MQAIDVLRTALQWTHEGILAIVSEMRDAPLTQPTANGNHPLWILGHLAVIEGNVTAAIRGEEHPVPHWKSLFDQGTVSQPDASIYPSFDELLDKFRELRARNLQLLEQIGDAGLDRPPKAIPPGFEEQMTSIGNTFLLLNLHHMVHYGQIADARRVAGLKPLL